MKSSVENVMSYKDINIPEEKLTIEIPSWDAVAQPLVDQARRQYEEMIGEPVDELTNEMVEALTLPGVQTIHQLKQTGMDVYQRNQTQLQFYNEVLPFVLNYYAENSNVVLNSSERDAYVSDYLVQVNAYADQYNMPLEQYGREQLKLEGNIKEQLEKRAEEDFIFKVIAHRVFENQGGRLDESAYEQFIHRNVVQQGADEIELREKFPYQSFKEMMPEMSLSQDIFEHFSKLIKFKINPDSILRV
ncbi:hypothetical protein HYQ40_09735 [Aerococcaceae bacterium DSM 111021]|nr:hypothetical protein [Aerococcaceae bacterium DSM 111021]